MDLEVSTVLLNVTGRITRMKWLISIFLLLISLKEEVADDKRSVYPEQIRDCLDSMNYYMGEETKYAELLSVSEVGKSGC